MEVTKEFVDSVMKKFPQVTNEQDLNDIKAFVQIHRRQGWSFRAIVDTIYCMEEVNPSLSEDYAIGRMAEIRRNPYY